MNSKFKFGTIIPAVLTLLPPEYQLTAACSGRTFFAVTGWFPVAWQTLLVTVSCTRVVAELITVLWTAEDIAVQSVVVWITCESEASGNVHYGCEARVYCERCSGPWTKGHVHSYVIH